MLNQYPYTNFHDLNLDWILKKIKEIFDKVDNIDGLLKLFVPTYQGDYDPSKKYDPLNVVYYNGGYYMAGKYVPVGVTPDSEEYWINISPLGWSVLSQFEYPDKYPGDSDSDRLQACFDACNNRIGTVILLVKNYTMDKNIKLPYNPNNYQNMTIIGLGSGTSINMGQYHFYGDSSEGAQYAGGYTFDNIFLYGTDYLFDADTLIRITCNNCGFQDFKSVVKSTSTRGYMQDYIFDNCRFQNISNYVFNGVTGMYSGCIHKSRFQYSGVFNIKNSNISKFSVRDCDIEQFTDSPFVVSGQAKNLDISDNYIEPFSVASHVCDFRDLNNGSVVICNNYYNAQATSGALVAIAGGYPNVSYTVHNNLLVGGMYLLSVFEREHHDLTLIDLCNNIGSKYYDTYNSIPLYRGNTAQNCYPGKEIVMLIPWGSAVQVDVPLTQPDLTGLAYTASAVYHGYYDDSGTFQSGSLKLTAQRLDNHMRLMCQTSDRATIAGKTVNVGIVFNY